MKKNQHIEALRRLKLMNIPNNWYLCFKIQHEISLSYFNGRIIASPQHVRNLVTSFENDNEVSVYHVIESHSNFGLIYCLLFVSNNTEQWDSEFIIDDKTNQKFALSKMVFIEKPERSRIEIIPVHYSGISFRYSNVIKKPKSVLTFNKKLKQMAF